MNGLDTSWLDDLPADLGSDADEAAAILTHWEPPIPAHYCAHGIESEDYPVPMIGATFTIAPLSTHDD
jgi:hypothetical protein